MLFFSYLTLPFVLALIIKCLVYVRVNAFATTFVKDESRLPSVFVAMSQTRPHVSRSSTSPRSQCPARSDTPPPVCSSSRVRRLNVTLDPDAIRVERFRVLRKKRGGVLSSITAKHKEIDDLLNDVNNLEAIKVKLAEITDLFQKFVESQNAYHRELVDEAHKEQSNAYFSEIEPSLRFFCDTVNDWLRITEVKLHEMAITPDDSASQVIPNEQHKHKSSCGSILSRASKASSISSARAEEAAKIAEIQAKAPALKRHRLHETEMNLKRQQYELELKR